MDEHTDTFACVLICAKYGSTIVFSCLIADWIMLVCSLSSTFS